MGKLNKKEYKFLPAFWLVTVILAIVVGLSYANRIKYSSGAVAGWFTPYCVKCEEINPQTVKVFSLTIKTLENVKLAKNG